MKKYRVKKEHPYLKNGLIVQNSGSSCDLGYNVYILGSEQALLAECIFDDWLEDNWIEEIKKSQFSEDDMINFGLKCSKKWQRKGIVSVKKEFNNWLKRKNENKNQ